MRNWEKALLILGAALGSLLISCGLGLVLMLLWNLFAFSLKLESSPYWLMILICFVPCFAIGLSRIPATLATIDRYRDLY